MKPINLVLPIAGESSRFDSTRPKWLLTHPKGTLMLTEAIRGLNPELFDHIIIIALQSHEKKCGFSKTLVNEISGEYNIEKSKINLVLLSKKTDNQPQTVYEGLKKFTLKGSLLIKDCDNYFKLNLKQASNNNFVAVADLNKLEYANTANKSYVRLGNNNTITNIAEKRIISNLFCCGAYFFHEIFEFMKYYEELSNNKNLYVSHIIYRMILDDYIFFAKESEEYNDWGTLKDWLNYKQKFVTIFVDLDGVLVMNSAEHFKPKWGTTKAIEDNINIINDLYNTGRVTIIITTSRKSSFKKITEKQLKKYEIKYHQLLMGLPVTKRILINDFSKTNPYKSAISINLERNSNNLRKFLSRLL